MTQSNDTMQKQGRYCPAKGNWETYGVWGDSVHFGFNISDRLVVQMPVVPEL